MAQTTGALSANNSRKEFLVAGAERLSFDFDFEKEYYANVRDFKTLAKHVRRWYNKSFKIAERNKEFLKEDTSTSLYNKIAKQGFKANAEKKRQALANYEKTLTTSRDQVLTGILSENPRAIEEVLDDFMDADYCENMRKSGFGVYGHRLQRLREKNPEALEKVREQLKGVVQEYLTTGRMPAQDTLEMHEIRRLYDETLHYKGKCLDVGDDIKNEPYTHPAALVCAEVLQRNIWKRWTKDSLITEQEARKKADAIQIHIANRRQDGSEILEKDKAINQEELNEQFRQSLTTFHQITGGSVHTIQKVNFVKGCRAHAELSEKELQLCHFFNGPTTYFHEFLHHVEYSSDEVWELCQLQWMELADSTTEMSEIYEGLPNELAPTGDASCRYMLKVYDKNRRMSAARFLQKNGYSQEEVDRLSVETGRFTGSSEVLTMSAQNLFRPFHWIKGQSQTEKMVAGDVNSFLNRSNTFTPVVTLANQIQNHPREIDFALGVLERANKGDFKRKDDVYSYVTDESIPEETRLAKLAQHRGYHLQDDGSPYLAAFLFDRNKDEKKGLQGFYRSTREFKTFEDKMFVGEKLTEEELREFVIDVINAGRKTVSGETQWDLLMETERFDFLVEPVRVSHPNMLDLTKKFRRNDPYLRHLESEGDKDFQGYLMHFKGRIHFLREGTSKEDFNLAKFYEMNEEEQEKTLNDAMKAGILSKETMVNAVRTNLALNTNLQYEGIRVSYKKGFVQCFGKKTTKVKCIASHDVDNRYSETGKLTVEKLKPWKRYEYSIEDIRR